MLFSRRFFLYGLSSAALSTGMMGKASAQKTNHLLRGAIDVTKMGVSANSGKNQSRLIQKAIDKAAIERRPLFLPAGRYVVANLTLSSNCFIIGIPGATELVYAGGKHFLRAEASEQIILEGLVFDGQNRALADYAPALLHFSTVAHARIEHCQFMRSVKNAITLDRVSGEVKSNWITDIQAAGLHANESNGLLITHNVVRKCGNNGILVWRWKAGDDGTFITHNRIEHISSTHGGTGQNGNGINVFRANSVNISNNDITHCDFSAVRCNSTVNTQIIANNCRHIGEVAIYSEFIFQGSVIASNIIDDSATGISITNFSSGGRLAVCQGNIVRNLRLKSLKPTETPTYGVGIEAEADTTITGNVIENAPYAGITLGWGPHLRDVIASSNVVREAGIGIAVSVAPDAGGAIITDNVIAKAQKGAILGMKWMKIATQDLTKEKVQIPSQLLVRNNQVK